MDERLCRLIERKQGTVLKRRVFPHFISSLIKKCTQIHLTPVNPLALFLPGCLMNLSPPRVVGVINDEKNLAPEEHKGWVGGDEALYHAVQTF